MRQGGSENKRQRETEKGVEREKRKRAKQRKKERERKRKRESVGEGTKSNLREDSLDRLSEVCDEFRSTTIKAIVCID